MTAAARATLALPTALALAFLVASCRPAPTPPPVETGVGSTPALVYGEARFNTDDPLPAGATLDLRLVGVSGAGETVVIGQQRVAVDGSPVPFVLAGAVADDVQGWSLDARISEASGALLFESPGPVPVQPDGDALLVDLIARTATPPVVVRHWQCDELRIAHADAPGNPPRIMVSGRWHRLGVASAAVAFDARAGGARLRLPGQPDRACVPSSHASPWHDAHARGRTFRAVGSEPGWLVEIGDGRAPPLHAVLDYGARQVTVPQLVRRPDGRRYDGRTLDGIPVTIDIARGPCVDPMSGEVFDNAATLTVGGAPYAGCGAHLVD